MCYWDALLTGLNLRKIHSTWTLKSLHIEQEFSRKAASRRGFFSLRLCAFALNPSTWTLKSLHLEQEFSRKAAKSQRILFFA